MSKCEYAYFISDKLPEDFLRIKFQIKHQLTEVFFYSGEFVHILPIYPRKLAEVLNELLQTSQKIMANIPSIELHIVNDGQMNYFNFYYMNKTGPTNILSFPGGKDMPGSLVLSLPTVARESCLFGQDLLAYLLHLLSHGIAHLAGYAHGREMEEFMDMLKYEYSMSRNLSEI